MNIECQEYDPQTGKILLTHSVPEESYVYMRDEAKLPLVCGSGSSSTHYVSGGQILERPKMELQQDKLELRADGEDTLRLEGMPIPSKVKIGGREYEVTDGIFEWSTLLPGTYKVKVESFPYLDYESEVIAIEGIAQADEG